MTSGKKYRCFFSTRHSVHQNAHDMCRIGTDAHDHNSGVRVESGYDVWEVPLHIDMQEISSLNN